MIRIMDNLNNKIKQVTKKNNPLIKEVTNRPERSLKKNATTYKHKLRKKNYEKIHKRGGIKNRK